MQPQPSVDDCLPRIDARTVGTVVVRLEALPGQQFGVGNDKIKLHPSLVGVLHPQHAVLVFIKSGHQNPLETLHQLFTLSGCKVTLGKRQHPGGVFLRIRRRVDKLPDVLRLALQHSRPFTLPVFAQQIIHRATSAAAAARVEFNNHRRRSPAPYAATAQARHRWPSARPPPEPGQRQTTGRR